MVSEYSVDVGLAVLPDLSPPLRISDVKQARMHRSDGDNIAQMIQSGEGVLSLSRGLSPRLGCRRLR